MGVLQIQVVTLFPEMLDALLAFGVTGRAAQRGLLQVQCWNPRDYTSDRHRTVDEIGRAHV